MPTDAHRSILFLAGDVSGDVYSAKLARLVSSRHPEWVLHALGGRQLGTAIADTGGTWIGDTTNLSAIGVYSAVAIYPRCKWLAILMRRFVRTHSIDAVVLCDWGGFNCGLLSFFKEAGIPILYYFPPRSWQRTGKPGLQVAPFVNRAATPFEWSARRLAAAGCQAEWVGHPLLESQPSHGRRDEVRRELGVRPDEILVALLPGSRTPELRVLAPCMAAAAELMRKEHQARFVVPVVEPLVPIVRSHFPSWVKILPGRAEDALLACDVAVVKTGTATLEAVVLGAPQVTVYDVGWLGRIEWLLLWMWKRIPFIAMPNIILQRMAVPELLGLDCSPEAIAEAVGELLRNDIARHRMISDYGEIRRQLGSELPAGATLRTVEILEEMVGAAAAEKTADEFVRALQLNS